MTRLEENKMVIEEMTGRTERKPAGTYEEMVTFHLGVIATMLADISKSLAILADKAEVEPQEDKCNTCAKAWTDDCSKHRCWDNEYSEYVKEKNNESI